MQLAIINREEFPVKSRRNKRREEREAEWAAVGQEQLGDLFSRLREVRRQVAAEIGKPAFIVMSDKSLQDLVLKRPTTLEAMADVYGFGEYKAKAYGKPFIEAIKQYVSDSADLPFPDGVALTEIASLMKRNTGGKSSRIKKLGLKDDESTNTTVDSSKKKEKSDGYKHELDRLIEMQADLNRQIEELRKKMEQ